MAAFSLRPATRLDDAFLLHLYGTTRTLEMSVVPWPEADKQRFLASQFQAREVYYLREFPRAHNQIILWGESNIGRLYLDRGDLEMRIVDLALLPGYQGRGIGASLIRDLQLEAIKTRKKLAGSVDRFNRAVGFWRRLGFQIHEAGSMYLPMEWRPPAISAPAELA